MNDVNEETIEMLARVAYERVCEKHPVTIDVRKLVSNIIIEAGYHPSVKYGNYYHTLRTEVKDRFSILMRKDKRYKVTGHMHTQYTATRHSYAS